jgi:hypothetical protein
MYNNLFGTPAEARRPSASSQRDWFILGAYPSALHVKWRSPTGEALSAVAVADEPEPFWEGNDQDSRIHEWANTLPWKPEWGQVSPPGKLNGSSGAWLRDQVLAPLRLRRAQMWITDCLDIYHESKGAAKRLNQTKMRTLFANLNIPDRILPLHPTEAQIVRRAQLDRLRAEYATCSPKWVITLGNAALAAFAMVIDGSIPISQLAPDASYGQVFELEFRSGSSVRLLPLAHPGAPGIYKRTHIKWVESKSRDA